MYKIILSILITLSYTFSISAENIINKVDKQRTYKYLSSKGTMIVKDKFGVRNISMQFFSSGKTKTLIEFTSVEEQGQKVLKTQNEIYLFYPEAEKIIRIKGAALRDSMMGSDVSYEDVTNDKNTVDRYNVNLLSQTDGEYKVELIAKKGEKVAYYKQIWYIKKSNFTIKKGEYYSLSNKLLKTMTVNSTMKNKDGTFFINDFIITNALKKNTSTRILFEAIDITSTIPENKFSINELTF